MKDEKTVKVWNLVKNDKMVRVATIEQNGRKAVDCAGCSAPCCQGALLPIINEYELRNCRFPVQFIIAPDWLQEQVPRAEYLAVLKMKDNGGCIFFDPIKKCTIYPNCPESCLSYSCKEDFRMNEIWRTGKLEREVMVSL